MAGVPVSLGGFTGGQGESRSRDTDTETQRDIEIETQRERHTKADGGETENHRCRRREVETDRERHMEAGGWCVVKMDGYETRVYDLWILFYEKADLSGESVK